MLCSESGLGGRSTNEAGVGSTWRPKKQSYIWMELDEPTLSVSILQFFNRLFLFQSFLFFLENILLLSYPIMSSPMEVLPIVRTTGASRYIASAVLTITAQRPIILVSSILAAGFCTYLLYNIIYNVFFHPYAKYPGPLLAKVTDLYAGYHAWKGDIHLDMWRCHEIYGDKVRYAPNRLNVNTVTGLKSKSTRGITFTFGTKYILILSRHLRSG
jgi:hypothetical protein